MAINRRTRNPLPTHPRQSETGINEYLFLRQIPVTPLDRKLGLDESAKRDKWPISHVNASWTADGEGDTSLWSAGL